MIHLLKGFKKSASVSKPKTGLDPPASTSTNTTIPTTPTAASAQNTTGPSAAQNVVPPAAGAGSPADGHPNYNSTNLDQMAADPSYRQQNLKHNCTHMNMNSYIGGFEG